MAEAFVNFLSGVGEGAASAVGTGVTSYLRSVIPRTSIIRAGRALGLSPNRILREMRQVGLGMRTQNFYQLIHQLDEGDGAPGGFSWGGPGSSIDPALINQLEGGQAGKFMVNVRSYYTSVDENGDLESGYRTTAILQDALDLDDAIQSAQQIMAQAYPESGGLPGTITGWDISSVNQWRG